MSGRERVRFEGHDDDDFDAAIDGALVGHLHTLGKYAHRNGVRPDAKHGVLQEGRQGTRRQALGAAELQPEEQE